MKLARIIAGWVLLLPVAGMMVMAGVTKLVNAESMRPMLEKPGTEGLWHNITLIAVGEIVSALLLLIPRTQSLGVLLTSAFWGGAICIHMAQNESYLMQAGLLLLTWVGATLRNLRTMTSFYEK